MPMPSQAPPHLNVLVVEDRDADFVLLEATLLEDDAGWNLTRAVDLEQALVMCRRRDLDLCFVDLSLPDASGLEALHALQEAAPELPLVILSGLQDERIAVQALREGAQEYLVKGQIDPAPLRRLAWSAVERHRTAGTVSSATPFGGLLARPQLERAIASAQARADRRGKLVGVLVVEAVGGEHETIVRDRLVSRVRSADALGYLGRGRFAVCLEDLVSPLAALGPCEELLADIRKPHGGQRPACRIGVAIFPADADSAAALLSAASAAAEAADPRPGWRFADPALDTAAHSRATLQGELARAVDNDELALHYQPIVSLDTGGLAGAEALMRWEHPERGLLGPDAFISIAEETGLIIELGDWALRRACIDAASWRAAGFEVPVNVNLSARQFGSIGLLASVEDALDAAGLPPHALELELTESVFAAPEAARHVLEGLRDLGVRVALDDFGTGFSSLTYLTEYAFDALKIDRSFVGRLPDSARSTTVVAAVLAMARELGMDVVGEGVETPEQRDLLADRGCARAQGYLFARPLPFPDFVDWIEAEAAAGTPPQGPTAPPDRHHAPAPPPASQPFRRTRSKFWRQAVALCIGSAIGLSLALPVQMPAAESCPPAGEGLQQCQLQKGYGRSATIFAGSAIGVFFVFQLVFTGAGRWRRRSWGYVPASTALAARDAHLLQAASWGSMPPSGADAAAPARGAAPAGARLSS